MTTRAFWPASAPTPFFDEDATLVAQALAGQQTAFALLVRRHERMVFSQALQIVGNADDARDVVQDTFLKVFRYLARFRGDCPFGAWLNKIVRSTAINRLRQQKHLATFSMQLPDEATQQIRDQNPNGLERLAADERRAHVGALLDLLSPEHRTALRLFYLEEQNIEEICATTGWTPVNVRSRLFRARKELRTYISSFQS